MTPPLAYDPERSPIAREMYEREVARARRDFPGRDEDTIRYHAATVFNWRTEARYDRWVERRDEYRAMFAELAGTSGSNVLTELFSEKIAEFDAAAGRVAPRLEAP